MNELENIVLLGLVNALAFWQRGRNYNVLFVPIAMIDIIYGLVRSAGAAIPSTTFYIGVAIAIVGLYCFIGEFLRPLVRRK